MTSVHVGITSVQWRVFSTVGIPSVQWGITSVQWGITSVQWGITSVLWRLLSTVETKIEILRIFKESRNLFQSLFRFEIRSSTSRDSIADHG